MVTIIFESHGTTFDNEDHVSSGHFDVALSPLGEKQSHEMGQRYINDKFDAIFCSDLKRSYNSAELAFGDHFPIIKDPRLRECDYGELTRHASSEVDAEKSNHITVPFEKGQSYQQTTDQMKEFLKSLLTMYDGKRVLVIGHRATQYALEHLILGKPLAEVIPAHWKWQPGWEYHLTTLPS